MISEPSYGLQIALVARLKGTAAITALVKDRVYDRWPAQPTYPAIAVGVGDQTLPTEEDDEITNGSETFLQIEVFSDAPNLGECKKIVGLVRSALRGWTPTVTDHQIDAIEYADSQFFRDDGFTNRGRMSFRIYSQADE
jgi:hypothetical protein